MRYYGAALLGIVAAFTLILLVGEASAQYYPPGEEPVHHCYAQTRAVGSKPVEVPCEPPPVTEPAQPSPLGEEPIASGPPVVTFKNLKWQDRKLFHRAEHFWHNAQPTMCTSIEVAKVYKSEMRDDGKAMGQATQPTERTDCHLWIVPAMRWCIERDVMEHEYGHLLGYGHSTEPGNIMDPYVTTKYCGIEERRAAKYRRNH